MNPAAFGAAAGACALGTQGTQGPDRITRNSYDAADQRLQLREGVGTGDEGTEASWAYNLDGQVTTLIDGNGNRAELVYDGHGRQNCWMFPSTTRAAAYNDATQASALASAGALSGTIAGGHCTTGNFEAYEYDPNGNRTRLRKRDGRYIFYAYDNLNRVTAKTYPQGGATPVYYSYDLRGLQLSARFDSQSGLGVANAYDGFGRQRTSTTDLTGPSPRTLTYGYDANGNRTRLVHPDGAQFNFWYDGLNRPYYLFHNGSGGMAYVSYHPIGAMGAMGHAGGTSYGYDGVQRPASLAHAFSGGAGSVVWTFGRNPAGQLNTIARDNDAFAWTGHYGVTRPYTTNGRNQYSATGSGQAETTFTYDDNGNLTSESTANVTRTYTYDIENRLIGASVPGGSTVQLGYDPLGRLSWTTGSPNFTRFLYDGDALVAEYDYSGILARRYVHGGNAADDPLVWYEGAGLTAPQWLHADHQGSIVAIANGAGALASINAYDEYGIPGTANTGRFQYTGQAWLAELGMYHYKARVYSPTLGRFLQTDPVGYEGGINLYAYAENDPVNQTDPSGTTPEIPCTGSRMACGDTNGGICSTCSGFGGLGYPRTDLHIDRSRFQFGERDQAGQREERVQIACVGPLTILRGACVWLFRQIVRSGRDSTPASRGTSATTSAADGVTRWLGPNYRVRQFRNGNMSFDSADGLRRFRIDFTQSGRGIFRGPHAQFEIRSSIHRNFGPLPGVPQHIYFWGW